VSARYAEIPNATNFVLVESACELVAYGVTVFGVLAACTAAIEYYVRKF
jgi:hypothetical protein